MLQRASAVEHEWLAPLLPRLSLAEEPGRIDRMMGETPTVPARAAAGEATNAAGGGGADGAGDVAGGGRPGKRRNEEGAVSAARMRFQERQRMRLQ